MIYIYLIKEINGKEVGIYAIERFRKKAELFLAAFQWYRYGGNCADPDHLHHAVSGLHVGSVRQRGPAAGGSRQQPNTKATEQNSSPKMASIRE